MTTARAILEKLQAYKLKETKVGREWRGNSPFREGSDSQSFVVLVEGDGEHGAYIDHVTGDSGSLYELARRLDVPIEKREEGPAPVRSTKRAYTGLIDYAAAHGVTPEVFRAAGWHEQRHYNRDALAIPTETGTRLRFLDGEKPYYKSPVTYVSCWYRLGEAVGLAQGTGQALVLVNGEASAVVGQHYGVAATCITGGSERTLPNEHLAALRVRYSGPILVALDCDKAGRENGPKLAAQLTAFGYDAQTVDMHLGPGGDLADFCRLHRGATVEALRKLSVRKALVEWVNSETVQQTPPISWLIAGEIPERSLVVLFGPSGAGKSFVALDYSLRLSEGGAVLYVAAEGYAGYADRLIAWCKQHGRGAGKLWFAGGNQVVTLLKREVVDAFVRCAEVMKPVMIVFDTLAWAMMGGEENAVKDMQQLISHCRVIQEQTGATVMLVHHTGKVGAAERGSSALRGGADMMIEVSNDDDVIALSCSKSKDAAPFETRYLKRKEVETRAGRTSLVWLPIREVAGQRPGDRLTKYQRVVLETLNAPVFHSVGARMSQLADAIPEINRRVLYRVLNRLMNERLGYVSQNSRGEPYKITEEGVKALNVTSGSGDGRREGEAAG